jgi:hypothetical protein
LKEPTQGYTLTEEKLVGQVRAKNPPEIVQIAEALHLRLKESGLETRELPSRWQYGVDVRVAFMPLVSLSAMYAWFQIPMRAVRALGDERFVASKQDINNVAIFLPSGRCFRSRQNECADPAIWNLGWQSRGICANRHSNCANRFYRSPSFSTMRQCETVWRINEERTLWR